MEELGSQTFSVETKSEKEVREEDFRLRSVWDPSVHYLFVTKRMNGKANES